MSMLSLRTNLMAINAARHLETSYSGLSNSVRRLSSGLRVGRAADDAAGLAVRELMRADIAAMNQGRRNTNDAISMIQVADGALQIIDEKLIRMKELAEQASTGTYDSTQRLMIDSEFQAMAAEIQRIATETNFNKVKLLDGSLSGDHDGSELKSEGALKVHFGAGNDSAEDYYYVEIGDATLDGLGLASIGGPRYANRPLLSDKLQNAPINGFDLGPRYQDFASGIISFGIIPAGTTNIFFHMFDEGLNDSLQLFTTSGVHIAGTPLASPNTDWSFQGVDATTVNSLVLTEANGFHAGATYDGSVLNGTGTNLPFISPGDPPVPGYTPGHTINYNGMTIRYTGEGDLGPFDPHNPHDRYWECMTIDVTTEDLVLVVVGQISFMIRAGWQRGGGGGGGGSGGGAVSAIAVNTQDKAQNALTRIDEAIVSKDKIRAHLGAMQNRLENTADNLTIQSENLQASESRISDADVAVEMTEFTKRAILTQAATSMLAQANSLPRMTLQLLQ